MKKRNQQSKKIYYYNIKLDEKLSEQDNKNSFFFKKDHIFIDTILELLSIKNQKCKDKKAILLHIKNLSSVGWAKLSNIRTILQQIKSNNTFILAYIESPHNKEYYLASVADKIVMMHSEICLPLGLHMELSFFKELFDKVGIFPQFEKKGKFKSYSEQFTRDSISEENREMLNTLLDDYYMNIVRTIAESRNIEINTMKDIIDNTPYSSVKAKEVGLIDELKYPDELKDYLKELLNTKEVISKSPYSYLGKRSIKNFFRKRSKIAVLSLNGTIIQGKSRSKYMIANETVSKVIKSISKKKSIKGVILIINSGGGSAVASDAIWRNIVKLKEKKPIVCLMQDVAASGGYYIGIASDTIIADPFSIIGSIGVVSGKFSVNGLLSKIGIGKSHLTKGKNANFFSLTKPFSDEQIEKLNNEIILSTYDTFIEKVSDSRKKSKEEIEEVAQGKVWSGARGIETGLIDFHGGFDLAIDKMLELLSHPQNFPFKLLFYPKHKWNINPLMLLQSRLSLLLNDLTINSYYQELKDIHLISNLTKDEKVLYYLPFNILIE